MEMALKKMTDRTAQKMGVIRERERANFGRTEGKDTRDTYIDQESWIHNFFLPIENLNLARTPLVIWLISNEW